MDVEFLGDTANALVTLVEADVDGSDTVGMKRIDETRSSKPIVGGTKHACDRTRSSQVHLQAYQIVSPLIRKLTTISMLS